MILKMQNLNRNETYSVQILHLLFMIYFYITAQKLLYNPYLPLPL